MRLGFLIALFVSLVFCCSPAHAQGEHDLAPPSIDSVIKLDRVGIGRRSTVNTDAIENMVAKGTFTTPAAGDEVIAPDGSLKTWQALEANENGAYPPIGGGWAYATVTAEQDSTWIMRGRGYRHVYINGEPRVGDLYSLGITSLPVRLKKGENTFLFKSGRGRLSVAFEPALSDMFLETRDATLPDYIRGNRSMVHAGVFITNATGTWMQGQVVRAWIDGDEESVAETVVPFIAPFAIHKLPVSLPACPEVDAETGSIKVRLELLDGGRAAGESIAFDLRVRNANQKHSRTFISGIDGSVQYFAVTPPTDAVVDQPESAQGLVLTLHGASVEARGQANAYGAKDGVYIVAPTNRRPFGFDWEDWGRLDAIEVLDLASELFNADPARVYLTGHSMGGHGTWSIGAYHAGRFAAIAPSAGWRDFWSYGGGGVFDTDSAVGRLLDRAANGSRTMLMKDNYFDLGVYVLHGDADDNVPVDQARHMRDQLAQTHTNFGYYEQPGAGHWWGNRCVDWAPIFSMFDYSRINGSARHVDFTTVDPGIASNRAWVTIQQQVIAREPSRLVASYDQGEHVVTVQTSNTAAFSLDLSVFISADQPESPGVRIDGMNDVLSGDRFAFTSRDGWITANFDAAEKSPARSGPFKDALRHNMLAVVGTIGTPEENAWALAKARYDAESFWYRGNGSIDIVRDTDFDPKAEPDRSIILYGNLSSNSAWYPLLGESPIQVASETVSLDAYRSGRDDLALLMARPRPNSDTAMVAVIGGSGIIGMRLTDQFPFVTSGVHYPDWFIAEPSIYLKADAGVVGAGFFDPDWSIGDDSAMREE
jgi:dienelactone hydrolase